MAEEQAAITDTPVLKNVSETMPNEIHLEDYQVEIFEDLFDDLMDQMKKINQLENNQKMIEQALISQKAEGMGTAKAIEKLIKNNVKRKGFLGNYVYDREKKILIKKM